MANVTGVQSVNQRPFYSVQRLECPRQALASGTTTMDTNPSHLIGITVSNTSGADVLFTAQGLAGGLQGIPTQTIPAGIAASFPFTYGDGYLSGWEVVTNNTGLNMYATWDRG